MIRVEHTFADSIQNWKWVPRARRTCGPAPRRPFHIHLEAPSGRRRRHGPDSAG